MSAQLLPEIPTGLVEVAVAWGADLTDVDGSGWSWTDITSDVRVADGLNGTGGRNDEASVANPATLTLTLDNSDAAYSLGGHSPNYPNVRRNVPVRVRVDPGPGGYLVLFQGYAVGFTPGWDVATGQIPVVRLEAAGVLRRLAQGKDPLRSALYRYHSLVAAPSEYWPLEETQTAVTGISATGGAPATLEVLSSGGVNYGKIEWGGDTDNPATERAVQVSAGGGLLCTIDTNNYTGNYWALSWSMKYSSKSGAFTKFATDDLVTNIRYHATWYTDGSMDMTLITDQSIAFTILSTPAYDNYLWDEVWHDYTMTVDYTGAATVHRFYRDGVLLSTNSATPGYRQRPRLLRFQSAANPSGTEDPVAVAHIATWNSAITPATISTAAHAHTGEAASARLTRLCGQQGVDIAITGSTTALMGPQRPLSFLTLLRECESADLGILYDGIGPGLAFLARDQRENADVDATFAITTLRGGFQPVDDDQRTVNRSTSSGRSGARYTAEDTTGPMGTAVVGVYDSSVDVNLSTDGEIPSYADWAVHLGTVEGYRYPSVMVDVKAQPSLAASVLALTPSARLVVTGVGATLAAMPTADVDLLVEGMAWRLTTMEWTVTFKCSPFGPWVVGELASDTGDTDPEVIRLRSDGSTLYGTTTAAGTQLFVSTPTGPRWSNASDDYPLYLNVGGVRMRATACAGTGTSQTFTVDAPGITRGVGLAVDVWDPPVLGL